MDATQFAELMAAVNDCRFLAMGICLGVGVSAGVLLGHIFFTAIKRRKWL